MLKNNTLVKIFIVGCAFYFNQPLYAQRVETVTEKTADVQEINSLYKSGKWEEGKQRVAELLKKNPEDSDMRMMLGKYYIEKKQYDKARYELVKSLAYTPSNLAAKQMLITVETETKRFSSAICYVNELLEVNPYGKALWRKKIDLYRTMGNEVEADRLLKRISQIYPEDNDLKKDQQYLVDQKVAAVKKVGRIDDVITLAKQAVDERPLEQENYLLIIDNYIKSGDYNNALVYTERGLNQFPNNASFVQKKIAILDHQKRYAEILTFLEAQIKTGGASMRDQYSYFLLEAARNAQSNTPATLYGKIFEGSNGNREAFEHVFNSLMAKDQFEEAIVVLNKHRRSVGNSKALDMKELMVYKRMQDNTKVASLTRAYFKKYPNDLELKESYVNQIILQAKANMQDGKTADAIADWKEVIKLGGDEAIATAQRGLYNAYVSDNRYHDAIMTLDDLLLDQPANADLLLKKADLYNKQERYDYAFRIYEQVLASASIEERNRLLSGYADMVQPRVKALRETYNLIQARQLCERWLSMDEKNQDALLYMINICYQLKDKEAMLRYAQLAERSYAGDIGFKIKLAEAMVLQNADNYDKSWSLLHQQVQENSFHEPLVNAFINASEEYAAKLLKAKAHTDALMVLDTALQYKENNKALKYMKGLAYEGLKVYDSAYYYQQFNEPTLLEIDAFKSHLNYLSQKSLTNTVGLAYLRARFGDDYKISTITTVDYTRLAKSGASYTARVNYAGRDNGKGIQGQAEWSTPWTEKLSSRIDLALANKHFAKIAVNAALYYELKSALEAEGAIGYRRFFTGQNLFNVNLGLTKNIENFRLSAKLSNFYLQTNTENKYLYNVSVKGQYFMTNPLNYLIAVGSIGNSPDIDVVNTQLYSGFNVANAMVGAGAGRSIARNITANVLGTMYNFQAEGLADAGKYRNLYNLYFQLNVSF